MHPHYAGFVACIRPTGRFDSTPDARCRRAGSYEWQGPRWSSVGRVVLPAIAGVMSGGLQGAGLVYLSGLHVEAGLSLWTHIAYKSCLANHLQTQPVVRTRPTCSMTIVPVRLANAVMSDDMATFPGCALSCHMSIHAASANQMLTGSLILFAAVLSRWILGRRLNKLHYMGCAVYADASLPSAQVWHNPSNVGCVRHRSWAAFRSLSGAGCQLSPSLLCAFQGFGRPANPDQAVSRLTTLWRAASA